MLLIFLQRLRHLTAPVSPKNKSKQNKIPEENFGDFLSPSRLIFDYFFKNGSHFGGYRSVDMIHAKIPFFIIDSAGRAAEKSGESIYLLVALFDKTDFHLRFLVGDNDIDLIFRLFQIGSGISQFLHRGHFVGPPIHTGFTFIGINTFAAAESCTGGQIAKRFTDLPGASAFFKGGMVTYTNEAKARLLGIDPQLIEEKGAVSYEVAKEMAERVRLIIGTDIGVGVTGLAGPDGDGVNPVGTVYVSMAVEGQSWIKRLDLGPHHTRGYIRQMAGNHAFDMIRRYVTGLPVM